MKDKTKQAIPSHLEQCGLDHRTKSTFTAMKGVLEVKECPTGYAISFYCSKADTLVSMFCKFEDVEIIERAFVD